MIMERIHQVLGNLVWTLKITKTYVDEEDPWSGLLDASVFATFSTAIMLKCCRPGQLVFGCDMILSINIRWFGN